MLQSRWQRKVDGTVLGVIHFRLTENYILMNEISEKTWNEELNKPFLVKIQLRENLYLTEYDLEIQNLERRNSEYALIESRRELESQRRQLLEANQWADQAQRERIHLCSELEMKNRLHQECYARSCQENEELRRRCFSEENGVTRQKWNEYSLQQDQESRTVSLLRDQIQKLQDRSEFIEDSKIFQDPDSPSSFGSAHVSHQALIPSSRESRMQRNTLEDMGIPGSAFDCQPARRVPEESYKDSRNLAAPSGIQRREGIEKSGSEEPLQPMPLPCFSGKLRKKSGRQKLS